MGNSESSSNKTCPNAAHPAIFCKINLTSSTSTSHQPGTFTANDSNLMVYGAYLEPRQIKKLSRQACDRQAMDLRRVSLLSCSSLGMSVNSEKTLVRAMARFLRSHAPRLEWLLITGPLLLESNEQACTLLQSIPTANLERLCLGVGQSANPELGNALAMILASSKKLQHLNLNGLPWRSKTALFALCQGVAKSKSLTWLDLTQCRITDEGFHLLVQTLTTAPDDKEAQEPCPLDTLVLRSNHMTCAALKDATALLSCRRVKVRNLNLSHMPLFEDAGDNHIDEFLEALRSNTTLRELHLGSTAMQQHVLDRLLRVIAEHPLQVLDVSGNPFSVQDRMKHLTEHLPRLANLSCLRAGSCGVDAQPQEGEPAEEQTDCSSEEEAAFLESLSCNSQLTQLVLEEDGTKKETPRWGTARAAAQVEESEDALKKKVRAQQFSRRVHSILERNFVAQHLRQSCDADEKAPPLAVWPHCLGTGRHHCAPASVTFQVLQRHLVSMATNN